MTSESAFSSFLIVAAINILILSNVHAEESKKVPIPKKCQAEISTRFKGMTRAETHRLAFCVDPCPPAPIRTMCKEIFVPIEFKFKKSQGKHANDSGWDVVESVTILGDYGESPLQD
jgi:hypothetical protein